MSKPLILSQKAWNGIYVRIKSEYPNSVFLIRNKMKEVLGFTVREHNEWKDNEPLYIDGHLIEGKNLRRTFHTSIHLDFYNESKRTLFLLKYSDIMHKVDH